MSLKGAVMNQTLDANVHPHIVRRTLTAICGEGQRAVVEQSRIGATVDATMQGAKESRIGSAKYALTHAAVAHLLGLCSLARCRL